MDRLDMLLDRIGEMFERWLKEFDEKPFRMGLKMIVGVIVLRVIYRMLRK